MLKKMNRCKLVANLGLGLLITMSSASAVGQGTATPPAGQDQAAVDEARAAKLAEAKEKIGKSLFDELNRLIPGDVAADSPAGQGIQVAIKSYMDRNGAKSRIVLEQQCKDNPAFPPADVLMAGLCFSTKDVANGSRFLETATIKNPDHPSVYAAYGRLALGGNRNVDAAVHFEKLFSILENSKLEEAVVTHYQNEYLDGMTQAASRLERYELARQLISQSRQRDPKNAKPLQILSEIAFKQDKLEESFGHLKELRKMNPDTRAPEAVVGSWYARKGDITKANEWMNKIPSQHSEDASALLEFASWSLSQESLDAASEAIKKAESLKGENPLSTGLKAKLAFVQLRFDDAVAGYQELLDSNPQNPDYANMLALSLIESGSVENRTKANLLSRENLKANPNNRIALAAAGYIRLQTLGVNQTIQAIFQKINETRDGRSPEIDYFLATFLNDIGQNQAAGQILQQSLRYKGLFLYRKQAEKLRDKLANSSLPTNN